MHLHRIISLILCLAALLSIQTEQSWAANDCAPSQALAREYADSLDTDSAQLVVVADTAGLHLVDSLQKPLVVEPQAAMQGNTKLEPLKLEPWKPNWRRSILYSALLPGLGQAYNKQYWKTPIVWGALAGCTYAITTNHRTYMEYVTAYRDLANKDPEHQSWINFIPPGANPADYVNSSELLSKLQRGSATYRRYRDLSVLITMGVYLLNILDAYVDAELFDFDISPDLTMHIVPELQRANAYQPQSLGVICQLRF